MSFLYFLYSFCKELLEEDIPSEENDIESKDTAVFYSVSSTQKGKVILNCQARVIFTLPF